MAEKKVRRVYLRKAKKVGNSAGVLLPKALLGADVRVTLVHLPLNVKRDVLRILEPMIEDVIGVCMIEKKESAVEILGITTNLDDKIEKGRYVINLIPVNVIKKLVKSDKVFLDKLKKSKVIVNRQIVSEIVKSVS